jgi:general secretion pathway protein C
MGPWLIKALNICLLGASCFLVANVVTEIGAEALEPSAVIDTGRTGETDDGGPRVSPSVILARNLFGAKLEGDRQVLNDRDQAELDDLAPSKLPLRLLGTAASSSEKLSRAAIEDEKTKKHVVVAVGDRFESHKRVRVSAIERTRVILDNAGKPEELRLHEDQPPAQAARSTRQPRQARRSIPRKRETTNDRLKTLNGKDGQGLSRILSSARIVPHYEDGEMLGMKVDAIKPDSMFEKIGLENGDVITEVNGIVVDRLESTSAIFDEFGSAEKLSVTTIRGVFTASATELGLESN